MGKIGQHLRKHGFWYLAAISVGFATYISTVGPYLIIIGCFLLVAIVGTLLGIGYMFPDQDYEQQRAAYEKAHYHQARKNTLKLVKGDRK